MCDAGNIERRGISTHTLRHKNVNANVFRPNNKKAASTEPAAFVVLGTCRYSLTLGELEASARFGFTVFFAFDNPAIAGKEAHLLQRLAQRRLIQAQRF